MLSSIRNRLRSSFNAAHSIDTSSASLASNRDATAVRPPAILRKGAARMTANRVQWDGIVRVKPIDLVASNPMCAKCDIKGCGCIRWGRDTIGGFRISLVTDEPFMEHRPILQRIAGRFSFGTPNLPTSFHVSLENPVAPVVVSSIDDIAQRRSKRSRRLINNPQLASVSRIMPVEADESFEASENVRPKQVHVALNNMPHRILKGLECHLNGTYWTAPVGSRRRAVV
ncbi:hypothetical protein ACHAW6_011681 [Cyclotella cf. meneghiniana]